MGSSGSSCDKFLLYRCWGCGWRAYGCTGSRVARRSLRRACLPHCRLYLWPQILRRRDHKLWQLVLEACGRAPDLSSMLLPDQYELHNTKVASAGELLVASMSS